MSNDFELAGPTREGLIFTKEDLLAPLSEGMLAGPHPMVAGTTDGSYYRGEVTGPTTDQVEWVERERPDEPTLDAARKAAKPAPVPATRAGGGH